MKARSIPDLSPVRWMGNLSLRCCPCVKNGLTSPKIFHSDSPRRTGKPMTTTSSGARFTPRHEQLIECEIFWLVHPDAEEGKDYQVDNLRALWESTFREDIWLCENQQLGIMSGSYRPGRYFQFAEGNVASIANWYMTDVAKS